MVDRVIRGIASAVPELLTGDPASVTPRLIRATYSTLTREATLVAVFAHEVPYTRELPCVRAIAPRLLELSRSIQRDARVSLEHETADLHLLNNLIASTLLQLVLDPPTDIAADTLLDALASRVASWARRP